MLRPSRIIACFSALQICLKSVLLDAQLYSTMSWTPGSWIGNLSFLSSLILRSSTSAQRMSFPLSGGQASLRRPTQPVPMTLPFMKTAAVDENLRRIVYSRAGRKQRWPAP